MNKRFQCDRGTINNTNVTQEGFLELWVTFSKVGELKYRDLQGKEFTEILTEDALFDPQSLATITGRPITLNHPPIEVTSENYRDWMRGTAASGAVRDGIFAKVLCVIHDQELIEAIREGHVREVSVGYTVTVEKRDGVLYQTDRKYNHIAILTGKGRAGKDVRIHYFDSMETPVDVDNLYYHTLENLMETDKKDSATEAEKVEIVKSDGMTYADMKTLMDSFGSMNSMLSALNEKCDGFFGSFAKKGEEEKEKKAKDNAEVKTDAEAYSIAYKAGKARAALEAQVAEVAGRFDGLESLSDREIKEKAIQKQRSGIKFDGKVDAYVDAMFDLIITEKAEQAVKEVVEATKPQAKQDSIEEIARKAYLESLKGGK